MGVLKTQSSPRQQGSMASTPCLTPQARWGQPQTIPALRGRSPQPICSSVSLWQTKTTLADGKPCQGGGDKPAFVSAKAKLALGKRLDSSTTGVCALAAFHLEVSNPCADDSRSLQHSLSLACPTRKTSWGSHCRCSLMQGLSACSTGPQMHTRSNRKTEPRGFDPSQLKSIYHPCFSFAPSRELGAQKHSSLGVSQAGSALLPSDLAHPVPSQRLNFTSMPVMISICKKQIPKDNRFSPISSLPQLWDECSLPACSEPEAAYPRSCPQHRPARALCLPHSQAITLR